MRVVLSGAEATDAGAVPAHAVIAPGASAVAAPLAEVIVDQASPIVLNTPGQTYQLQTSLRFAGNGIYIAAPNVTLDLNGHSIYYGGGNANTVNDHLLGAHGVVVYIGWHNTEISIPGATNPDQATIKNGRIIHEGAGAVSHAIYGRQGLGATIQDVYAEASGKDTHSVFFYSGNFSLYRNTLISHSAQTFDRHAGPANVHGTTVVAHNNVLLGGNSGFTVLENSEIIGNVISHDGHVTNGYAVWLYRTENVVVRDNIILPANGRGVLLNAGTNIEVSDNVILHLEAPNAEFGDALNAPAIRSRYNTSGNTITGNTGLGIAGANVGLAAASGLYLSDDGTGLPSRYEDNDLTTILVGARGISHYAQPITLEGYGYTNRSPNSISGNTFRSNDTIVRVQGWDGTMENAAPIVGNTMEWIDGNPAAANFLAVVSAKLAEIQMNNNAAAIQVINSASAQIQSLIQGVPLNPDRATWFLKYGTHTEKVDGTFLDNQAASGVSLDAFAYHFLSAGEVSVKIGQTVPIVLHGASGPLAPSSVQITTDRADGYDETTSGAGGVHVPVIEFAFEKPYAGNSPIVKQNRATTTITVAGYQPLTLANSLLLSHKHDPTPWVVQLTPIGSTAPQAAADSYNAREDTTLLVSAAGVLLNDSDPLTRALSAVLVTGAAHGIVVLNGDGSFSYTPNANYRGADSFSYRAVAGSDLSSIAIVSIQVDSVNDAPAGTNRTITLLEDASHSFSIADFGFTDPSDAPANAFTAVRISSLPIAGQLLLSGAAVSAGQFVSAADISAGRLRFTPAANAHGSTYASFTFQVQDDGGTANGGANLDPTPNTMALNVTPVNDAPSGSNQSVSLSEDAFYTFTAANFGFTDVFDSPANNFAAVRISTLPAAGQLLLSGVAVTAGQSITAAQLTGGGLRFIPAANAHGSSYASFTFQVQDDGGTANGGANLDLTPNTMTLNVTSVNDPPTGTNKTVTTAEDTAYVFAVVDFGFNDPQDVPANGFAAVRITTLPVAGQLLLNGAAVTAGQVVSASQLAAGWLRFVPAPHAHGINYAGFTFQVQDDGGTAGGGGDLDPTPNTLSVTVTSVNDFPLGIDRVVSTQQGAPYTFLLTDFGFHDPADSPSNNVLAVRVTTLPNSGALTNNGSPVTAGQFVSAADILAGRLRFVPIAGGSGTAYASFTFQVQDDGGNANGGMSLDLVPNTITIDVTPAVVGLSGAWRFEEGVGLFAHDTSGNGNHATLQGANFATGRFDGGLQMTQASKWAKAPNSPSLNPGNSVTLAAWIAPLASGTQTFLAKSRMNEVDGFELSLSNSGKVFARFNQRTSGDAFRLDSRANYPTDGTWMHVAVTYDGAQIRLYIDGVLQAIKAASFTIAANALDLGLGADSVGDRGMRGRMDDALVANRAFNSAEIANLYSGALLSGSVPNTAPIVNAGSDLATTTGVAVNLNGSVSDDGLPQPGAISSQWSLVNGPGSVTFGNPTSPTTSATFSAAGTYVLRLTATDGSLTGADDVNIQVSPTGTSSLLGFWNFLPSVGGGYPSAIGHLGAMQNGASVSGDGRLTLTSANQSYLVADMPALQITQAITLAAWIKPASGGAQSIVKKAAGNSGDGFELGLSDTGMVFVRFNEQSAANTLRVDSTSSYPTSGAQWMHVAATYDGATIRLYINGQLQASRAAGFTIGASGQPLLFGSGLIGQMDEVLLDNRALSATEIDQVYRGQLQPAVPANRAPTVQAGADLSVQAGVPVLLSGSAVDDGQPGGPLTYQWIAVSGPGAVNFGNANSAQTSATFAASGVYQLRLWASDGQYPVSDDILVTVTPASANSDLVGFWHFEGAGPTVVDSSGKQNHGSLRGGATLGVGQSGGGLLLSQTGQSALVPHHPDLMPTQQITVAAWIAPIVKGTQAVVSKATMSAVDGYEVSLSNSGKVFVRFNQKSAGDSLRVDSTTNYSTNGGWLHVVATYDGAVIRLFINGQLEGAKSASFNIAANTLGLGIGAETTGSRGMRGRIDDVLISSRALSAGEVATLFSGANPLAASAGSMVLVAAPDPVADPLAVMDPTILSEASDLNLSSAEDTFGDWTPAAAPLLFLDEVVDDVDVTDLVAGETSEDDPLIAELAVARWLSE